MAKPTVDSIIEEANALEPNDRERLITELISTERPEGQPSQRDAVRRALRAAGLVTQIKTSRKGLPADRRLIDVTGKPVSETIVEERR